MDIVLQLEYIIKEYKKDNKSRNTLDNKDDLITMTEMMVLFRDLQDRVSYLERKYCSTERTVLTHSFQKPPSMDLDTSNFPNN
jgi:hypothetical protein